MYFASVAFALIFQLTSSRRGWQFIYRNGGFEMSISTHILTKRMTRPPANDCRWIRHFNSHPHEEDDADNSCLSKLRCISTHILTKRMTALGLVIGLVATHFNSHPHEEDDCSTVLSIVLSWYFNSHPHEEDDCEPCGLTYSVVHFNSHPHEEDDVPLL